MTKLFALNTITEKKKLSHNEIKDMRMKMLNKILSKEGKYVYSPMCQAKFLIKTNTKKSIENEEITIKYIEELARLVYKNYKHIISITENDFKIRKLMQKFMKKKDLIIYVFYDKEGKDKLTRITSPAQILQGMIITEQRYVGIEKIFI